MTGAAEERLFFRTGEGTTVPAITAEEMRTVDRIAMEEYGLGILQMMENAGRNLAGNAIEMLGAEAGTITVLAGAGGNGGGGICAARHLHNRGYDIRLVLDKEPDRLGSAASTQFGIVQAAGLVSCHVANVGTESAAVDAIAGSNLVVDALIGYSLKGAPRGVTAELIELCNRSRALTLALDVPSGLDATTGATPGVAIVPDRTLTLALPKTGLIGVSGELYLADIGIPLNVYKGIGLTLEPFFGDRYWKQLSTVTPGGSDP